MNLGSIAAATLTPVIIGYLLKSFPVDLKSEDFPSKAELNKRWGKQYKIMSFASLPVMAFGVYLTWLILVFLTKMTAVDTSDAVLAYLPNDFMQLLPAVFLGIFFTAAVMLGSERLLANKERLREFIYYQQLKSGGNSRKLLGRMAMVMVPAALVLSILLADQYALFNKNTIVINTFTHVDERVYSYEQLKAIEHISIVYRKNQTNEETGRKQVIKLVFSDKNIWRTDAGGDVYDLSEKKDEKLLALLQSKTDLMIRELSPEVIWRD